MISLIAAVGKNGELGKDGKLCFHLREDMKFFKKTTMGHPVVMGRTTYESLPGGALPGRQNFVMTRSHADYPAVEELNSIEQALERFEKCKEVFVIGGGSIYKEFLPYADKIYLTEIDAAADADVFFPKFDKKKFKKEVIGKGEENGIAYSFVIYSK